MEREPNVNRCWVIKKNGVCKKPNWPSGFFEEKTVHISLEVFLGTTYKYPLYKAYKRGISHRSKLGRGTIQLFRDIPSPKERPWYDSLRLLMYLGWVFFPSRVSIRLVVGSFPKRNL